MLSQKKQTANVICLHTVVYCFLFSPLPYSMVNFYLFGQSFCLSVRATSANSLTAVFRATNIWRNATLPSVRCRSFAFYKVVQ